MAILFDMTGLNRWKKLLLGVCCVLPILYVALFMVIGFGTIILQIYGFAFGGFPNLFAVLFPVHITMILWIFALQFVLIIYVVKTDTIAEDKKALWVVVLLLGHFIAFPVFWYFYIWKTPPPVG